MNTSSKGFTIIELLVVVAIIAVLTGIVLTNVSLYINRAKDASIKENMHSMLTDATLFFDSNNSYVGLCDDAISGFVNAFNEAKNRMKSGGTAFCKDEDVQWAAYVQINNPTNSGPSSSGEAWWCVDSTGTKIEETSEPKEPTICPEIGK